MVWERQHQIEYEKLCFRWTHALYDNDILAMFVSKWNYIQHESKHESVNDIGNITSDMIKAASNIKWI